VDQPLSSDEWNLVGRRFYSVVFVEDYVQLLFDSDVGEEGGPPHLDFFVLPQVRIGKRLLEPGDAEWAGTLTSLIGSTVVEFQVSPDVGLVLQLSTGVVALQADGQFDTAVEVALLETPGVLEVWRPGEGAFQAI
jgi:hypothetical protein